MTRPFTCETAGGQVAITFNGKPPENIRAALKAKRFRWNPRQKCWWRRGVNGVADLLGWLDKQYEPERLYPCHRAHPDGTKCGNPARVRSYAAQTLVLCGACWKDFQKAQLSQQRGDN